MMKQYQGKSVFRGIAVGRVHIYRKEPWQVKRCEVRDPQAEMQRFLSARNQVIGQLRVLYENVLEKTSETDAAIFQGQRMLLEDETYLKAVEDIIRIQAVNAEYAVAAAGERFVSIFAAMEDAYMRERAADVKDISERVLSVLQGCNSEGEPAVFAGRSGDVECLEEPVILIAEDLTPSETVRLDRSKVLALVTVRGSVHSHTAILARSMGIPALVGIGIMPDISMEGRLAAVDGNAGYIYVEPDDVTMEELRRKMAEEGKRKELLLSMKGKESVTLDGRKVMLCANIGDVRELKAVFSNDAEGIGLLRSEFLYLGKTIFPLEEEQFQVYKTVTERMAGRPVIIRTLDIGADKQAAYLKSGYLPAEEANPAMGLRGIRFCLTRQDIFRTQLRALLRAGVYGKLSVMFPMITSVEEIRQAKDVVESVRTELERDGIPYGEVKLGVMIETPAAAVISDLLAEEADFFSIGTNDLTQYLLAIDRQNEELEMFYDTHHKAVLRLIFQTVQNAHEAGIWCGICGELAADPMLTKLFLAMGVDELSVAPDNVPLIRKIVRECNVGEEREEQLGKWL